MVAGEHYGQQCMYDSQKELILGGDGAGSADWYSSPKGLHKGHDVEPFNLAVSLDNGLNQPIKTLDSFVKPVIYDFKI